MNFLCLLLSVLSIWDYPARFPTHDRLSRQFRVAVREGDTATMEETCRKGVKLLPDDPTWHYNLACSLAYYPNRTEEAFDELETAVDLGFRDRGMIEKDTDLKRLSALPRYKELLEYADFMKARPLLNGPMATVAATGVFGKPVALGEQNLGWDFESGSFVAKLKLVAGSSGGNVGDLYMNRDGRHAMLDVTNYPGVTVVQLDEEGRKRRMDMSLPNVLFPYPTFGNASLAITQGPFRRSLPRALMTTESAQLNRMAKFYLSNQVWAFPSVFDTAPVGTNGDLFASITPYCLTTAGRSWSDLPYLRAALIASRSLDPQVKATIVRQQLLAPTIQTLIRKSLKGVKTEEAYLTAAAHPTALPPNGVDRERLTASAKALTAAAVPPLVPVAVAAAPVAKKPVHPELTYASSFAWAFVLRAEEDRREFLVTARGAKEYAFVQTHGKNVDVKIERVRPDAAKVTIDRRGLNPTNRVDIMVCGRNPGTGWGAPSYVSFARMDPGAPYSDPALTVLEQPKAEAPAKKQ